MSETFANDRHSEMVDEQLLHRPTVDMGTPIDELNADVRFHGDGVGVTSAGNPPLLRSQFQPDDIGSVAVKTEIGELKSVDSMPHLMPMTSDNFPVEKKDIDTEDWVPMVSQLYVPYLM